eukprot:SAG31_NODE_67_length_28318_cov_6.493674_17_plen_93_part_00
MNTVFVSNVNKLETTTDVRHALASQPTYAQYLALCGDQRWDDPSPACVAAINDFTDETGTGGLAGSTYNIVRHIQILLQIKAHSAHACLWGG